MVRDQGIDMCADSEKDQSSKTPAKGLYDSPQEALKKVSSEYEYWSGKLTETSLQMCYALIGANWIIFGSVNGILHSNWAKSSLVLVFLALGSNVIAALMLSEFLRSHIGYAEGHIETWDEEYNAAIGKDVAWPFTDRIQNTGRTMRWIKAGFTIASAICLIIGAILK